jgi:hypothetical protein
VPESKKRKKPASAPSPAATRTPKKKGPSPRWLAPLMLVLFLIGIAWLVTFYITASTDDGMPLTGDLGNGNLLVGFGFILAGFGLSTQWR